MNREPQAWMSWECIYLKTARGRLFRGLARAEGRLGRALVMCPPLGEEAKASFAVLSGLARRSWGAGCSVARFDYLGTGDSEGEFSRTFPGDWLDDAANVVKSVDSAASPSAITLMGLRLGANVAARLAMRMNQEGRPPAGLILWEPILDFSAFRRRLSWTNRLKDDAEGIDAFGWRYSRACLEALEPQLAFEAARLDSLCPATSILIALTGASMSPLGVGWTNEGGTDDPHRRVLRLKTQPFWELIGQTDAGELIERTVAWMGEVREAVCCV